MAFWLNEWEAMVACMVLGVLVPFILASRQPLDTVSSGKKSNKTSINYITRPIFGWEFSPSSTFNFAHVGWMGPTISMILCVFFSLYYHYENTTKTHCNVPNPLPSISAAVGNNLPERWFFRYGILLMSHQRLLDSSIQYTWMQRHIPAVRQYQILNYIMYYFQWIENIALFTIAFVSSTEYYPLHEKSFILWAFFQQGKMIIQIYLGGKITNHPHGPLWEKRSWSVRVGLYIVNTICLFIAGFVFYTHMNNCIPYLYAFYALLEYVIVGSNILFNCCVLMDWSELWISVSTVAPYKDSEEPHLLPSHTDKPSTD